MQSQPLDEMFLVWLYRQVADPDIKDPSLTYWKLVKQLFTTEFVWIIPNDDNRSEEGKELRQRFIQEEGLDRVDPNWMDIGCSMMELILGLAHRLSFQAEGEPHYWFWKLMENLDIHRYSDDRRFQRRRVADILDRVIFRTYGADGRGGLFPLEHPDQDMRNVELWYQLSAYVLELDE